MIQTSGTELHLINLLQESHKEVYNHPSKRQGFLLLYRCFLAATDKEPDSFHRSQAKKCGFIADVLSEKELSKLLHAMDCQGLQNGQVLSRNDAGIITSLDHMYPDSLIDDSAIVRVGSRGFVFCKEDVPKLTKRHFSILSALAETEQLANPVYVEVSENGRLVVD